MVLFQYCEVMIVIIILCRYGPSLESLAPPFIAKTIAFLYSKNSMLLHRKKKQAQIYIANFRGTNAIKMHIFRVRISCYLNTCYLKLQLDALVIQLQRSRCCSGKPTRVLNYLQLPTLVNASTHFLWFPRKSAFQQVLSQL